MHRPRDLVNVPMSMSTTIFVDSWFPPACHYFVVSKMSWGLEHEARGVD